MRKVTEKNSLFVKIMAGVLAAMSIVGILATAIIMMLQ
jgi:hypothetical protein